eukprot:1333347-Amorphochlora_amoeboformis.AAC.3
MTRPQRLPGDMLCLERYASGGQSVLAGTPCGLRKSINRATACSRTPKSIRRVSKPHPVQETLDLNVFSLAAPIAYPR